VRRVRMYTCVALAWMHACQALATCTRIYVQMHEDMQGKVSSKLVS
jgi:hypothetical protein